jgi:hypothetical protein
LELEALWFAKERVLYPAFRHHDEARAWIEQGARDIRQMRTLLNAGDLAGLGEEFEQSVRAEENEFFPWVRRTLRRPEREALGRHLEEARRQGAAAA